MLLLHGLGIILLLISGSYEASTIEEQEQYPKTVKWKEQRTYYFSSLKEKVHLTFLDECIRHVRIIDNYRVSLPEGPLDMFISSFPPSEEMVAFWRGIQRPQQMRQEPQLCESPYRRKRPIFLADGCQLPTYMLPSAPRCQSSYLKWICDNSKLAMNDTKRNSFVIPEADHRKSLLPPDPFLIVARFNLVSMCGQILAKCGIVHLSTSCQGQFQITQARRMETSCGSKSLKPSVSYNTTRRCQLATPFSNDILNIKRIFVVAETDDTHVYHIHLEIMPRIVYHLDFLLANPDVFILIGCDSKNNQKLTESGIRYGLLTLKPFMDIIGLSMSRLVVHRHVYADEIYLPMEGACQDPVYNTWQILNMRRVFLNKLKIVHTNETSSNRKRQMVLIKRSVGAKHTRNNHDLVRQWSDVFTNKLLAELRERFPSYDVALFSDKNVTLMNCHSCQIEAVAHADVLVGVHGAGLAHQLYMKPNSAIVEIGPYSNDGRILLGGGPFSRLAAVMGNNYMIHHPPHEEYIWIRRQSTSEFNVSNLVIHMTSFLGSIGRL